MRPRISPERPRSRRTNAAIGGVSRTTAGQARAVTLSYVLLSLLASLLLLLGALGALMPDGLAPLGEKLAASIQQNWDAFIVTGLLIGAVNLLLLIRRR